MPALMLCIIQLIETKIMNNQRARVHNFDWFNHESSSIQTQQKAFTKLRRVGRATLIPTAIIHN
jgi:hypothetical protein